MQCHLASTLTPHQGLPISLMGQPIWPSNSITILHRDTPMPIHTGLHVHPALGHVLLQIKSAVASAALLSAVPLKVTCCWHCLPARDIHIQSALPIHQPSPPISDEAVLFLAAANATCACLPQAEKVPQATCMPLYADILSQECVHV